MSLQPQYLDIPLGVAGEAENLDPFFVDQPKLGDSENVVIAKGGALERRTGFVANRTFTFSDTYRTAIRDGNKVDISGAGHSYNEIGVGGTNVLATSPIVNSTSEVLLTSTAFQSYNADSCIFNNKLYVVAYTNPYDGTSTARIRVYIYDLATRALISGHENLIVHTIGATSSWHARILVVNSRVCVIYSTSHHLYCRRINTGDNGFDNDSQITTIAKNSTSVNAWDACSYGAYIWAAYYAAASVEVIQCDYLGTTPGYASQSDFGIPTGAALTTYPTISISHDNVSTTPADATVHLLYGPVDTNHYLISTVYGADLGSIKGRVITYTHTPAHTIYFRGATSAYDTTLAKYVAVFVDENATVGSTSLWTKYFLCSRTDGAITSGSQVTGFELLHKMAPGPYVGVTGFKSSLLATEPYGSAYTMTWFDDGTDKTLAPCARYNAPDISGQYPLNDFSRSTFIPSVVVSGGKYYWCTTVSVAILGLSNIPGICLNTFTPETTLANTNIKSTGKEVLISGSLPSIWDEIGLHVLGGVTDKPTVWSYTIGTGFITAGVYIWCFVFETLSGDTVINSQVSRPVTITIAGSADEVTFKIRQPIVRHKAPLTAAGETSAGVRSRVTTYRTLVGGSIFYRVRSDDTASHYDATNELITVIDDNADSSISSNATLYTEGGILENYPCPPAVDLEKHQDRLWAISSDTGDIFYSKQRYVTEGYSFNPALVVNNPRSVKPVALKSLSYQVLLVFYTDATYYIQGEGPADNGTGGYYSIQELSSIHGCVNNRSIIKTDAGVFFAAFEGIMAIPAGLGVPQMLGDDLRDTYLAHKALIVGAVELQTQHELRWVCSDGTVMVYNQLYGAWLRWELFTSSPILRDSYVLSEKQYVNYAVSPTFKECEQGTAYYDFISAPLYYSYAIETPWIKVAGILGYQRVWKALLLLENAASGNRYSVSAVIYGDYSVTSILENIVITDTESHGTIPMVLRFGIANQRTSSIKLRFTIQQYGAYEIANIKIKGLRLEYGILPGSHRGPRLKV